MSEEPTICFAVGALFDSVSAKFVEWRDDTPHVFGWREPARHKTTASRFAWVPGDEGGRIGSIGAPKYIGKVRRQIMTLDELFVVYVSGFDPRAPESERAQYRETRRLIDLWFTAVNAVAAGTYSVKDVSWDQSQNERRHGAMAMITATVEAPIFDEDRLVALVDAQASVQTTMGDHTESSLEPTPED